MTRYAARKDSTHKEVKAALIACGCLVEETWPAIDFVVTEPRTKLIKLVDAKTKRKDGGKDELTETQARMVKDGWEIYFVYSAEEAIALVDKWRQR